MRYPWWLNLVKSLMMLIFLGLFIVFLIHPLIGTQIVTDEVLRDKIVDKSYTNPDINERGREPIRRRIHGMIDSASFRGAYLALAGAVLWLGFAAAADLRIVWAPGVAKRYFWGGWLWILIIAAAAIWAAEADGFWWVWLSDPTSALPPKLDALFGRNLMFLTTVAGILEFWLLCCLITPPAIQPAVFGGRVIGRLVGYLWQVGRVERKSL